MRSAPTPVLAGLLCVALASTSCREDLRWDCPAALQSSDDDLAGGFFRPLPVPAGEDGRTNVDVADPHVIRDGDRYVLYATSPGHDLRAWTSDDLCRWSDATVVWEPEAGAWNARGMLWAPSVHPGEAGWYLYYTADLKIGVAWAASPLGPFEDVSDGPLLDPGPGGVAIDPFVFEDDDGRLGLFSTWSPAGALSVTPLADHATVGGEPVPLLEPGGAEWEGHIAEAPWVSRVDDRILLTYSGNETWTSRYALGAAISDDAFGPFERSSDGPFLESDPDTDLFGPGHHSFVEGPDGSTLAFFHGKLGAADGFDRRLMMARVELGEDGEVTFAPPP